MSIIKANRIENLTTTDGGVSINNSGNVGIGESNPAQPLVVSGGDIDPGDVADTRKGTIHLVNLSGTQAQGTISNGISFGRAGSGRRKALIGSIQTGADNDQIGIGVYTNSTTSTGIDTVTQKLIVSHDGKVGIGTDSPTQELEIKADGPVIRLHDSDTALSDEEVSSGIEFYQSDNSGAGVGASIKAKGDGTTGNLQLDFSTGNEDRAMTIFASGITRVYHLAGSGNRALYASPAGSFTTSSSDASLKTNVTTLDSQLEVVKQLNPISFNWIDTEERGDQLEIGFIAQEVQPLVPEVIGANSDGTLTVDYPKMTAVLTKGLQEALAKIETLETQNADLLARVTALENA